MKSKAEIVVETLLHYNLKNRGYNRAEGHCTYFDKSTGNKCAVGRCILDSEIEKVSEYEEKHIKENSGSPSFAKLAENFNDIDYLLSPEYRGHDVDKENSGRPSFAKLAENFNDIDYLLSPEYRGRDVDFWGNLQYIHDGSHFWNEDGFDHSINMTFIAGAFGKEVADAVMEAFAEKTA